MLEILEKQCKIKDFINHVKENVIDRILELCHGQSVDIVYGSTYLVISFEKIYNQNS